MNSKIISVLVVIVSVIAFALSASMSVSIVHSQPTNQVVPFSSTVGSFNGNVTILANGKISTNSKGVSVPVTHSGNYYNFTENINGTFDVMSSGAIINGLGHSLYYNYSYNYYGISPMVNITGVDNVTVSDLSISSTTEAGVLVDNASHVNLNKLNISVLDVGVEVYKNTSHIGVTNSEISLNISSLYAYGIASYQGNHDNFSSNSINLSGANDYAIYESNSSTNNTSIENNLINMNGTTLYGIELNGTNQLVNGNHINILQASAFTGIFDNTNVGYHPGDIKILDNIIRGNLTSPVNMITGISLHSNLTFQKIDVTGNQVMINTTTFVGSVSPFYLKNANNSVISSNEYLSNAFLFGNGFALNNLTNSTVTGNSFNSSLEGFGFEVSGGNGNAIYANIVTNSGYSLSYLSNSTFFGNTLNAPQSLEISNSRNLTIYHNNFMESSAGITTSQNIRFNQSYPIGGNFWGNLATSDHYSGPNQNIAGSDGLNDTQYNISSGYVDYYPLVKPWTNPEAVFNETGILPGVSWSVTFNGVTKTSTGSQIVFKIVNGIYQNYSYKINTVNSYTGGGESGTYSYTGNNSYSANATFVPQYVFKIEEKGLPSGTSWYVKVNGTNHDIKSTNYTVDATNGTSFTYSPENTSLYYTNTAAGSSTIDNSKVTVNVTYYHWAYISGDFNQSGVNVSINGKQIGSGDFKFNETATAGTYHVVISGKGYKTDYDNFTLSPGQSMNISAALNPVKNKTSAPSSPGDLIYVVIGVVSAVIVGSGATLVIRRRK